jgi:MFS family permease
MAHRPRGFVGAALADYRTAVLSFSRPANLLLVSRLFGWSALGVNQVLFNLFLLESDWSVSFVGMAVALEGFGIAGAALPAGAIANRWGRGNCLVVGGCLFSTGLLSRVSSDVAVVILASSFVVGAGQSMLVVAAAPFLAEHSSARERTYLFSALFAVELLAGVIGNVMGGFLPQLVPQTSLREAYRHILVGAGVAACASLAPLICVRLYGRGARHALTAPASDEPSRNLIPIVINAFVIGIGAGLVVPFMNIYFKSRFGCSSSDIGLYLSIAQLLTAITGLAAPILARRFGKLRTAAGLQLLSLPFLVVLGAESWLAVAVVAFWVRTALMQASTPLHSAFVMEVLPAARRARAMGRSSLAWNLGRALSASVSGLAIQTVDIAISFYIAAVLYATSAIFFYWWFRDSALDVDVGAHASGEEAVSRGVR